MRSLLNLFSVVFVVLMLQTSSLTTNNFNKSFSDSHRRENRPGKRHTKFIIPALISHMYHQKLDDSPLSTILNRPSGKRASKQNNEKRESATNLEHRIIVANPKKDEHVRNVPKTKCSGAKRKEPVLIEVQSHRRADQSGSKRCKAERERNVVQVSKHFSPLARNWYAGPSAVWPAPAPYRVNYGMPLEQYPNLRYPRPLYPSSAFQQEGVLQHIMGQPRRFSSELKGGGPNKNIIAQEKKFMVTNLTKYVLDFYCPHCGGEISVSKNRNRGVFNSEPGAITINKVERDRNISKDQTTKSSLTVTKIDQK